MKKLNVICLSLLLGAALSCKETKKDVEKVSDDVEEAVEIAIEDSSADGKSTGGHWNPTAEPHGKWGDAGGFHKGDIGNFLANEDGSAEVSFETDAWCIGCGDPNKDILGKAVIVHQGVDDFTSQPSGAAGARISCTGIIE